MENNEFKSEDRPKPLRTLARLNNTGEYHGQHEAEPPQHRRKKAEPRKGVKRKKSRAYEESAVPDVRRRKKIKSKNQTLKSRELKIRKFKNQESESEVTTKAGRIGNKTIQIVSIISTLVIVVLMVLNMPICLDNENGGNISLVTFFKNMQPAAMEGKLNKDNINLNVNPDAVDEDFNDGLDLPQLIEGQYSILFLGFDEEEFNTDVMWVVQFDIGHGGLNILQIPRDTCLPDYTASVTRKFNSIYSMGDPTIMPPIQRTVNAVQENFGIPIDAYVTTACFDIVDIVNIIGGIPMHVENEIIYEADKIIPEGDIVLTGEQAEWFVRFRREWIQGDIGRMQNQRKFMAAAMQKLFSIVENEGRLKLYSYIKEIYDKGLLYTDLSIGDLGKIADFASTINMDEVQVNMIPGEDAKFYAADGNIYDVYSVHKEATIELLNKYYRPYQKDMTEEDTSIVELITEYQYELYDDTGATLDDIEDATEPMRDPSKKPWWKED
ncbi:MAG: LCP family protein [Ruminococcus sp.]|nr:LCP family protein [Ruminococcus sp.]